MLYKGREFMLCHTPSKIPFVIKGFLVIIHPNDNRLRRDAMPLVRHSGLLRFFSHAFEVGRFGMRGWLSLVALEHHVKQCFHVHDLVLEAYPDGSGNIPWDVRLSVGIQSSESRADSLLVVDDF